MAEKYIGKYRLIKTINKGGMGRIYLAQHPTLKRDVILKKLTFRGSREIRERFIREAELMMDLSSDYLVKVYDHFKVGSVHYLVLEYINGLSLEEIIKRDGALQNSVVAMIALDVARALTYIHSRGVIHRDIKPGNILIDRSGRVKLTDFGIASVGEMDSIDNNSSVEILGTPYYMSPEQFETIKNSTVKSDIYSYGVVLYEMLTGLKPFMGEINEALYKSIKKGRYYRISRMNRRASALLSAISRKAMSKRVTNRESDFTGIIKLLIRFLKKKGATRSELKELITGSRGSNKKFEDLLMEKKRERRLKSRVLLSFSTLIIILLFLVFHKTGGTYKILKSPYWGSLKIQNLTGEKLGSNSIEIYKENRDDLVKVEPFKVSYNNNFYLTLKSGSYRIVLNQYNRKSYYSLFIESYRNSKKNILLITDDEKKEIPVNTDFKFKDSVTGVELKGAAVSVKINGNYVLYRSGLLKSGREYQFKIEKSGYYTDYFFVETDYKDSDLLINSELIPLKCELDINTNIDKGRVLINGNNFYRQGGVDQRVIKTQPLNRSMKLVLNPGIYTITLISLSGEREERSVILESGKRYIISMP